jgi:regulator of protease activity HflC (stomatin/prohibitin superfamily)
MTLEFLQAVTGIFVVVYDGQHALKFTLGRAQEVVGPGLHFKLPIVQRFSVQNTKHTTLDLEPQVIQLKDDLVYEVDCKLIYQIVDLRKAIIEIDNLVTGLQNRVVMAVQRVVQAQDRDSIRDTRRLAEEVRTELAPIEEQWGARILQFGFSNISPSPATLEITQLDLLARERLALYGILRQRGLSEEAAVALISGAVVAMQPAGGGGERDGGLARQLSEERAIAEGLKRAAETGTGTEGGTEERAGGDAGGPSDGT